MTVDIPIFTRYLSLGVWILYYVCLMLDFFFCSPELKAQVSFYDHLSSGVCLSVRPSVRLSVNFSHNFSSSSTEPLGQFQPNLAQSILGWRGLKFVQMKGPPFPRGDNYTNSENILTKFKNLLLKNHWANFNQTWHKASVGEGDSRLFK